MYRFLLLTFFITTFNIGWAKPIDTALAIEYFQGELDSNQQLNHVVFTPVKHTFNLDIREPIVWLKLTITNNTDRKQSLVLFNHFAYLSEQTTFYDSRYLTSPIANFKANSLSNNENFIANIWQQTIELESHQTRVFYLRSHSLYSQVYKFSLHKESETAKQLVGHNMFALFIIAVLLALAFYNLALYFYGESKAFLFYFLYLLNGAIGGAYLYGLFFQFSDTHYHLLKWFNLTPIMIPAFSALYTKYSLEVKKYSSTANNLLTMVVVVCLINFSIAVIFGISTGMKLVPLSFLFSFVVVAIVAWKMLL
ncbi:MAG: hypothetical protein HRU04_25430, partial [Oceanospirillaceae bacterium]|nr:hypothetical protein [Oceanospirillaceae bacterium]